VEAVVVRAVKFALAALVARLLRLVGEAAVRRSKAAAAVAPVAHHLINALAERVVLRVGVAVLPVAPVDKHALTRCPVLVVKRCLSHWKSCYRSFYSR